MRKNELQKPTEEQCKEFAKNVCWAHSWYQHISLQKGAEFVFFLSQEAGQGYSKENPRLHYAWKTTQEYRHRFGYLDYMYRLSDGQFFYRDSVAPIFVPSSELLSHCATILYPYVSNDFNAQSMLAGIIEEDGLDKAIRPPNRPDLQQVFQWFEIHQDQEQKWYELSDSERELVCRLDRQKQPDIVNKLAELPIEAANFIRLEMRATNLYEALQKSELDKIKSAIARLCALSGTEVRVWW